MLAIRLRRVGSKKRPHFRVVVTEARAPRDGAFLEVLGHYDPRRTPAGVTVDRERLQYWIDRGARPSNTVRTLVARHLSESAAEPGAVEGAAAEPVAAS